MAARAKTLTPESIDRECEEAFEAYHATVRAGKANTELSHRHYVLDRLRSAYYLYLDLEELK